jgi:hypothetical protein
VIALALAGAILKTIVIFILVIFVVGLFVGALLH